MRLTKIAKSDADKSDFTNRLFIGEHNSFYNGTEKVS